MLSHIDHNPSQVTPLATQPTANEDFRPESANYYTTVVLTATWPAFLGLGAFAALLISFFLSRLILSCSGCKRKRLGRADQAFLTSPRPPSPADATAVRLRAALVVVFMGVAAGCIYGMVKVNAELIDRGVATLNGVSGYIESVIDAAGGSVAAAQDIDAALVAVQRIIDVDVNATGES